MAFLSFYLATYAPPNLFKIPLQQSPKQDHDLYNFKEIDLDINMNVEGAIV